MREIIYVEKNTVTQGGKTVLEETRYHGLLGEDGSFRLLGYCGKRLPLQKMEAAESSSPAPKQNRAA